MRPRGPLLRRTWGFSPDSVPRSSCGMRSCAPRPAGLLASSLQAGGSSRHPQTVCTCAFIFLGWQSQGVRSAQPRARFYCVQASPAELARLIVARLLPRLQPVLWAPGPEPAGAELAGSGQGARPCARCLAFPTAEAAAGSSTPSTAPCTRPQVPWARATSGVALGLDRRPGSGGFSPLAVLGCEHTKAALLLLAPTKGDLKPWLEPTAAGAWAARGSRVGGILTRGFPPVLDQLRPVSGLRSDFPRGWGGHRRGLRWTHAARGTSVRLPAPALGWPSVRPQCPRAHVSAPPSVEPGAAYDPQPRARPVPGKPLRPGVRVL